jgi:hypothetical protein
MLSRCDTAHIHCHIFTINTLLKVISELRALKSELRRVSESRPCKTLKLDFNFNLRYMYIVVALNNAFS